MEEAGDNMAINMASTAANTSRIQLALIRTLALMLIATLISPVFSVFP
jgi:hypothetical protein